MTLAIAVRCRRHRNHRGRLLSAIQRSAISSSPRRERPTRRGACKCLSNLLIGLGTNKRINLLFTVLLRSTREEGGSRHSSYSDWDHFSALTLGFWVVITAAATRDMDICQLREMLCIPVDTSAVRCSSGSTCLSFIQLLRLSTVLRRGMQSSQNRIARRRRWWLWGVCSI